MSPLRRSLPLLCAFLLAPVTADTLSGSVEEEATSGFRIEGFDWSRVLSAEDRVQVYNPYGNVAVRGSGTDAVTLSAQIQRLGPAGLPFRVQVADEGGTITARVRYGEEEHHERRGLDQGRVDLALLMPAHGQLAIETLEGNIDVKKFHGPELAATTRGGRITVFAPSRVTARSESGAIRVFLYAEHWNGPHSLTSRSGPIQLGVLTSANLAIYAQSEGPIRVDLPAALTPRLTTQPGWSGVVLGELPQWCRVHSDSGEVRLVATSPERFLTDDAGE